MENSLEILSIIGTIVLVVAVFYGAYLASRFVGKHYNPHAGTHRNIKIIESMSVGRDKTLMIIKAADKVVLVGSSSKGFTALAELDPENLETDFNDAGNPSNFLSILKNATKARKNHEEGEDNR